jgi:hypothetical protein
MRGHGAMSTTERQFEQIITKLEKIEQGGAEPIRPAADIVESLRAAAADWMETDIGYAYGQTVLDILDGK